jgi:uncharacterized protein (DUF302 family)
MKDVSYGITKNLGKINFDEAIIKVTEALKTEGFGILTDIDVQATLKKKIDVDTRKYRILGACNPPLAHKSIMAEPLVGLLLPCNVVVMEDEDNTVVVSAANPLEMFKIVENNAVADTVKVVNDKITRAIGSL